VGYRSAEPFHLTTLTKAIFKNKDGSQGTLFLISNIESVAADEMISIYKLRFKIKDGHRAAKQEVGISKCPARHVQSQLNHICCCFIALLKMSLLAKKLNLTPRKLKADLIETGGGVSLGLFRSIFRSKVSDFPLIF
jgi:hypothetical protein